MSPLDPRRSRRALRRGGLVLAGLALAAPALGAPPAAVPELGHLVSGTAQYVGGSFVWTDYAYDDRGANTLETSIIGPRGAPPGSPARSGGDAVYPDWAAPGNTADLIQLQISRPPQGLVIRAILETLVDAELPVLGVAFDTDANPATGAAALPGGAWPAQGPLGIELLAVVASTGAELRAWNATTGTWVVTGSFQATVDPEANTLEARLPNGALPPTGGSWRAFGVLGLRNPSTGGSWLDGSEPIFDLAFVGGEPFVQWQDLRQSDILVGALASGDAAAALDFAKVLGGATELVDELAPGFKTFLYHSRLELPEGVTTPAPQVSTGQHEYLGPYQPYLVFAPAVLTQGRPLRVSMHGSNNNHMLSIFVVPNGAYVGTAREGTEDFFLVSMFAPDAALNTRLPATLVAFVLGRGETLNYRGISELDVLEATDDAVARLGTDPDRVSLEGASMGGIGAYRLGTLYPDRWAAIFPLIGTGVQYRHLFGNLHNLPVRQLNGFLDSGELGPPSENDAITLEDLDSVYHYWLGLQRGHELPAYTYCIHDQQIDFVRDPNPSRVVYAIDPSLFQSDPSRDVEIAYDAAYWVSGMALRDEALPGRIDATSLALPHSNETVVTKTEIRENMTAGRDSCGDNPSFAPGWSPVHPAGESWLERSLVRVPGAPLPLENSIDVELLNLAAAALDLARAGFAAGEAGAIEVSSDGAVTLDLSGLRQNARILVDGLERARASHAGTASLALPSGAHSLALGACTHGAGGAC